jgi:hypothetical protein
MIDLSELHAQNHRLTEISNVLLYLALDRSLCDTDTARRLFLDYVAESQQHLEAVDGLVCRRMLTDANPRTRNLARKMTADSSFLRHTIQDYRRHWSDSREQPLHIRDHGDFVADTRDLFELVLERIQRETELLYPLLQRLDEGERKVA